MIISDTTISSSIKRTQGTGIRVPDELERIDGCLDDRRPNQGLYIWTFFDFGPSFAPLSHARSGSLSNDYYYLYTITK